MLLAHIVALKADDFMGTLVKNPTEFVGVVYVGGPCSSSQRLPHQMTNTTDEELESSKHLLRHLLESAGEGFYCEQRQPGEVLYTYAYVTTTHRGLFSTAIAVFIGEYDELPEEASDAMMISQAKIERKFAASTMEANIFAICRGIVACLWVEDFRNAIGFYQQG